MYRKVNTPGKADIRQTSEPSRDCNVLVLAFLRRNSLSPDKTEAALTLILLLVEDKTYPSEGPGRPIGAKIG